MIVKLANYLRRKFQEAGLLVPFGTTWRIAIDLFEEQKEHSTELVPCAGCKHWRYSGNNLFGEDYGTCVECLMDTKKDFFCAYGERGTDDGKL